MAVNMGQASSTTDTRSVVMLTPDRQIDRRILLQADSLEAAGWSVIILAMPLDTDASVPESDHRIVRIGGTADASTDNGNLALRAYRWLRRKKIMNSRLLRLVKRTAWQYMIEQESFYLKLFLDSALQYSPYIFVAEDLPMLSVARQAAAHCGAKLIYDSHELYSEQEFPERERRRWIAIEAKHIHACDAVITVNRSIANELERRYAISNVNVIYNAERTRRDLVKTKLFHKILGLKADRKILLYQGSITVGRNLQTLVEAMSYVHNPATDLVILGNGPLQPQLLAYVKAHSLSQRVYFHPAVPQENLLEYTAAANAGIIPYQATCLNNYYCTPNKLFEFIAAGLPILASDLPEIRNIVQGQQIGLVGDMSTAQSLANMIDSFFSNEHIIETWQKNILLTRTHICWEEEAKKLVQIFQAI